MINESAEKRTMAENGSTGSSIHSVAQRAGVSVVTVSRVFNDYPHVSDRMRKRVLKAARECGYNPRVVAPPRVLAALVGHLDIAEAGDYKTRLFLHIVQAAAESNYLVDFIPASASELATKNLVNGIIEISLTPSEVTQLDALPDVPTVAINNASGGASWYVVGSDHHAEAAVATRYLLDKGHRRIGCILDELEGWPVESRTRGYRQTLTASGISDMPPLLAADSVSPSEIAALLKREGCTACLNFSDNYGLAVLDSLATGLGMSIPGDISVICLENSAVSPFYRPRLTTIAQPLERIAQAAVETIIGVIEGEEMPRTRLFESELIERDSVRAL